MKVALSLEITDAQRRELSNQIAGKVTSRLATRDEVRDFVAGAIASLGGGEGVGGGGSEEAHRPNDSLSADERAVAERLRAQGKSEGYIRGWLAKPRHS